MEVVCKKCGLMDDYTVITKSNQDTAWCNGCGEFIKNIPKAEGKPTLYFGKYRGTLIEEVTDLGYLEWALREVKLSPYSKNAVVKRIEELKK